MNKCITLVVPLFNEAKNIPVLYDRVIDVLGSISGAYEYELLFVDDGSTDGSLREVELLAEKDSRVRSLQLSRNFGKEQALSAGISEAKGDAVVLMDADLQHPPELIKDFITEWERGADVVVGLRKKNPDEGLVRRAGSKLFSFLMNKVGDVSFVSGATDFRLLDRIVVDEFKKFAEHDRLTRGLIDWLGFKRAYVSFDAHKRHSGEVQYSYKKLSKLAFSSLLSHSLLPLRFVAYLGIPITVFAGSLGLAIIVEQFLLGDPLLWDISPIGMIAVMILFLNGLVLICLGLMSLYIEKIHNETANRPLFVVRRSNNSSRASK